MGSLGWRTSGPRPVEDRPACWLLPPMSRATAMLVPNSTPVGAVIRHLLCRCRGSVALLHNRPQPPLCVCPGRRLLYVHSSQLHEPAADHAIASLHCPHEQYSPWSWQTDLAATHHATLQWWLVLTVVVTTTCLQIHGYRRLYIYTRIWVEDSCRDLVWCANENESW